MAKKTTVVLPLGLAKITISPDAEAVYEYLYQIKKMGEPVQIAKSLIAKKNKMFSPTCYPSS